MSARREPLRPSARSLRWSAAVALVFVPATAVQFAAAQQPAAASDAVDCIALRQIERASVVDENTIVFRLRGGEIYRNDLPNDCPTLTGENTFMYLVTTGELCSVDMITVLLDAGSRFVPGESCGLGSFTPIGAVEAAALEVETRRRAEDRR